MPTLKARVSEFRNAMDRTNSANLIEQWTAVMVDTMDATGVFRRLCHQITMNSQVVNVPLMDEPAAVAVVGEAQPITPVDAALERVVLDATRKAVVRIVASTELLEDATGDLASQMLASIANQLAADEDSEIIARIQAELPAGQKVPAANAAAITLSDLLSARALVDHYQQARRAWVFHPSVYATVLETIGSLGNIDSATFLGDPLELSNQMPDSTAATSGQPLALYGDWQGGAFYGMRRSIVGVNTEVGPNRAAQDQMEMYGFNQFGFALNPVVESIAAITVT